MNNPKPPSFPVLSLITLLFSVTHALAQTPPSPSELAVTVTGLNSTAGKLMVNFFRAQDDLFGKP